MVNGQDTIDPERALVLSYAPPAARAGLAALLALDDRLGAIARRPGDAMARQFRLTWWFEALERLDRASPPAEPVLTALAMSVLPAGVTGTVLAGMIEGWEVLIGDEPPDAAALAGAAAARGGRLFVAAAQMLGTVDTRVAAAGEGWALADWAVRPPGQPADAAAALARGRLDAALARRWPTRLRALGALALLARSDLTGGVSGSPMRVGRLAWHRLTGG